MNMSFATYLFTLVGYVFVYTSLNRMMLRQLQREDQNATAALSSGMLREISKSISIIGVLFNSDLPKNEYSIQLKIYIYTARIMLCFFPFFAVIVWFI